MKTSLTPEMIAQLHAAAQADQGQCRFVDPRQAASAVSVSRRVTDRSGFVPNVKNDFGSTGFSGSSGIAGIGTTSFRQPRSNANAATAA